MLGWRLRDCVLIGGDELKVWMGFDLLHQNLWWPEVKSAHKFVRGR